MPSVIEHTVEVFLAGVFAVELIQRFGAHDPMLEIIAKIGLFLVSDRIIDSFPAMMSGKRVIEAAPPAAFQVGQARRAMIDPRRLADNSGVLPTIPATQAHGWSFR
jgi:hypothetical protein